MSDQRTNLAAAVAAFGPERVDSILAGFRVNLDALMEAKQDLVTAAKRWRKVPDSRTTILLQFAVDRLVEAEAAYYAPVAS